MYKAFSYMAFLACGVFSVGAFYAYPYVYLPVAGGLGYLGYYLYNKA